MCRDKLSNELKLLGRCVLGRGSIEKSGWAVIYVTRNDVMRPIFLGDKEKWWRCYLRETEKERREVKCQQNISSLRYIIR